MTVYFDSSALAKAYLVEAGTDRVEQLLREAGEVVLSVLCVPEVLSAASRLRRGGLVTAEQYLRIKDELTGDVGEATVMDLTPEVIARAIRCLEDTPLRTLDALHLGAALSYPCDLLVSADRRQTEAAGLLGLTAELVGAGRAPA